MLNYGTIVQSTVRPPSSDDNLPVALAKELLGGYMQINSLTTVNTEIPKARRVEGMMVFCLDTKQIYILQQDLVTWNLTTTSSILIDETGSFLIIDGNNKVAFRISPTGMVDFAGLGNIFKYELNNFLRAEGYANVGTEIEKLADINHIITYGQSLAVGQSEKIITNVPFHPNAVSFVSGGLTNNLYFTGSVDYSSLTPLYERSSDLQVLINESPVSGTAEYFINSINKGINFDKIVLSSNPSQGALSISELSKGTSHYQRLINDVIGGAILATNLQKSYKVLAVTFSQGEQDYINGTTYQAYKTALIKLKNDINTDIRDITGQREDVKFIIYQTSTINNLSVTPEIAYAQFDAAIEENNIYMATPTYHFSYGDEYHLKAVYSKLLGLYYGKTLYDIITKGYFKPLHIVNHIINDNVIELYFNYPDFNNVGNFTLATAKPHSLTITNYGFKLLNSESEDIIVNVTIKENLFNNKAIVITCNELINTGFTILYGTDKFNIPNTKVNAGNFYIPSTKPPLNIDGYNVNFDIWCPIFKYVI